MNREYKVLLPQPIEKEAVDYLEKNRCEIVICDKCEKEEILEKVKDADAIVLRTGITIDSEIIATGKQLKTISRTGAGVDNVDLKAASEAGIVVTSSIGANTTSVIEHALSMILCIAKRLTTLDSEIRKGNFSIRYKNISSDLLGKTLGVVGFGRIGSGLASICKNLGMKVIAFDEYLPEPIKKEMAGWVDFKSFDQLFQLSDYISIHIPLTEKTKNIINIEKFRMMKKSGVIINTSRGGVINENDLITALTDDTIAYAGLDVFEKEPLHEENKLITLENIIMTPHTAALTKECTARMAVAAVERVVAFFEGKPPTNVANIDVLTT